MSMKPIMMVAASAFALGLLAAPAVSAADAKAAEKVWKAKCASCHGTDGKGATKQGEKMGVGDMTTEAWQKEFTDDKIKASMNDGLKRDKDGKKQEMKSFKDKVTAAEMDDIVAFIRTLKK